MKLLLAVSLVVYIVLLFINNKYFYGPYASHEKAGIALIANFLLCFAVLPVITDLAILSPKGCPKEYGGHLVPICIAYMIPLVLSMLPLRRK